MFESNNIVTFNGLDNSSSYQTFLLDEERSQLYVGAKDHIFSFNLVNIKEYRKVMSNILSFFKVTFYLDRGEQTTSHFNYCLSLPHSVNLCLDCSTLVCWFGQGWHDMMLAQLPTPQFLQFLENWCLRKKARLEPFFWRVNFLCELIFLYLILWILVSSLEWQILYINGLFSLCLIRVWNFSGFNLCQGWNIGSDDRYKSPWVCFEYISLIPK